MTSCTSFVGHYPRTNREILLELAESCEPEEGPDYYGIAPWMQRFEDLVATLLGKEAATFMMSGTIAQQALLRVVCEIKSNRTVGVAPQSHLLEPEKHGLSELHAIRVIQIGSKYRLFSLEDFERIGETIAALVVEVPDRNLGGDLRSWEQLVEMTTTIRAQGVWLHMDGARLWEAQEFYHRPVSEISALFDSVYVSFYKDLGALAGAALAGPEYVIGQTSIWRLRHGGRLYQMFPYVVSARRGLQDLQMIGAYFRRAREFAHSLADVSSVHLLPDPPKTNMFQIIFECDRERLKSVAREVARESGVWILGWIEDAERPGWAFGEVSVAQAGLDLEVGVFKDVIVEISDRIRSRSSRSERRKNHSDSLDRDGTT